MPVEKIDSALLARDLTPKGSSPVIYWDPTLPRFGLKVQPRRGVREQGKRTWIIQYRDGGGKSRQHVVGDGALLSYAVAKKEAFKLLGGVELGRDPLAEQEKEKEAAKGTVKAIGEQFLAEKTSMRSHAERKRVLEQLVYPHFGTRPLTQIKRSDIAPWLTEIKTERGPYAARHAFIALQRLMNWHSLRADDYTPPIVRGLASDFFSGLLQSRDRVLDDDELRAVWKAAESGEAGTVGEWIRFILLTATRSKEASRMMWKELSEDGKTWEIPAERYKTGKAHVIPLSSAAQDILERRKLARIGNSPWVFTNNGIVPIQPGGAGKNKFNTLAGVKERWTVHDLRRTARTLLARAGVPDEHAERSLGHATQISSMDKVYNQYAYLEEKRGAFEKLAQLIESIVSEQSGKVVKLRA